MELLDKFQKWDKDHEVCKQHVINHWHRCNDKSLRDASVHMQECFDEYYEVTKAILSTDQNPYSFLEQGSYLSSWESVSSFIQTFRHSCIDDGEHCYLSDPLHGPVLLFRCHHDYEPQELYYIVHPQNKEFDEIEKEPSKREFEFHNDYKRFIKELNERPKFERKRTSFQKTLKFE